MQASRVPFAVVLLSAIVGCADDPGEPAGDGTSSSSEGGGSSASSATGSTGVGSGDADSGSSQTSGSSETGPGTTGVVDSSSGDSSSTGEEIWPYAFGEVLASVDVPMAEAVVVHGDYAYVSAKSGGVHVFDVEPPSLLVEVATIDPEVGSPNSWDAAVNDADVLVVANRGAGLTVHDVSDPTNPQPLGAISLPSGDVEAVAIDGDTVYATTNGLGGALHVVDISTPGSPVDLGQTDLGLAGLSLDFAGAVVYVGTGDGTLAMFDVSDPGNPIPLGNLTPGMCDAWGQNVFAHEASGRLYFANYGCGVEILDIVDPMSPLPQGTITTAGLAYGVWGDDTRAYVASAADLHVYDTTDPTSVTDVGTIDAMVDLPDGHHDVVVIGNLAYLADNLGSQFTIVSVGNRP